MTLTQSLLTFACFFLMVHAVPITFRDCTGSNQTLSVDVSPCSTDPCVFSHNVTAAVKVTFKSPADSPSLKGNIYGSVLGVWVPWPMPNPDGCKNCSIGCPVSAGKTYTYTASLGVPKGTPAISLVVKWNMIGAGQEQQFCFTFPMEIS